VPRENKIKMLAQQNNKHKRIFTLRFEALDEKYIFTNRGDILLKKNEKEFFDGD